MRPLISVAMLVGTLGWLASEAVGHRWPECRLAVCTPTPIDPGCTVRGFNRAARRWVTRAVGEVTAVSERIDAVLVPLHGLPTAGFADGVHPSRDGSRAIAAAVATRIGVERRRSGVERTP